MNAAKPVGGRSLAPPTGSTCIIKKEKSKTRQTRAAVCVLLLFMGGGGGGPHKHQHPPKHTPTQPHTHTHTRSTSRAALQVSGWEGSRRPPSFLSVSGAVLAAAALLAVLLAALVRRVGCELPPLCLGC